MPNVEKLDMENQPSSIQPEMLPEQLEKVETVNLSHKIHTHMQAIAIMLRFTY